MDTAQWPQGIGLVKPMEEFLGSSTSSSTATNTINSSRPPAAAAMERRARPQKEQALNCPRCNSTNTKFCYYNNYSLTQPRYFCKTCRRYWTEGGSLRNVPVGGGSRKNKRTSSSSNTTTNTTTTSTSTSSVLPSISTTTSQPSSSLSSIKFHQGQDLNLGFTHPPTIPEFGELPNMDSGGNSTNPSTALSAVELLRSGMSGRGLSPFMHMPMSMPEAGAVAFAPSFGMHDFRPPTLNFPLVDGGAGAGANDYGAMQGVQENAGRLLFPFEDLRQVPSGSGADQSGHGGDHPPTFWNGMIGGGDGGAGGGGGGW